MGAYNTLHASVACSNCGAVTEQAIQFKYGDKWLYDYRVGDTLRWGGNDEGIPGAARVRVEGYSMPEACSACGFENEYYLISVERDVVSGVRAVS